MNRKWLAGAGSVGAASLLFGAAALAQTPSPGITPTAQATGTTTVVGGTVTAGATGTVTRIVTGTVSPGATVTGGVSTPFPTAIIGTNIYAPGGQGNFPFAHPAFQRTWNRTDRLVSEGRVQRTFFWGPGPNTPGLLEQYNESPLGNRLRLVQYFDKSRMELNNPAGDQNNPFFVTNGLLTVDLISGSVQVGENEFTRYRNACIPMSGDFGDQLAPTYFAFQKVSVNADRTDANPAQNRVGQSITATIDRNGNVGVDAAKGTDARARVSVYITETRHNIPAAFWDFLNSRGPIYNNNNQVTEEQLIQPWFFASGLPISEAYWTRATIQGQVRDVMIQAFERRALTYVPTNPAGFQVEMANIGQHYFDWRYRNFGYCPNEPGRTPTAPVPAPTGTVVSGSPTAVRTGTVVGTTTVVGTGTAVGTVTRVATGSPAATGTTTPPGTIVPNPTTTVPRVPPGVSPTP
jgi:hypothetical protein